MNVEFCIFIEIHVRIATVGMDNAGFKDQAHTVCATQDTQVQVATDLSPEVMKTRRRNLYGVHLNYAQKSQPKLKPSTINLC